MTVIDINNPYNPGNPAFDNNPIAFASPMHNPTGHSPGTRYCRGDNNPDGKVPVLNPEQYIHPLTGHYSTGPLDFAQPAKA